MKRHRRSFLWWYFTAIVFVIMLTAALIVGGTTILLYNRGVLGNFGHAPMTPVFLLFVTSLIIGTLISMLIGRKILLPIARFSAAAKEVAKGNFNVRLEETSRVREIRELSHSFNVMAQELSGTETLRNDFVVDVSHEFKTPLAAIEGYATLLQDTGLSEEERAEYTRMILDSARSLSTLTGNILKLSKLENQELITDRHAFRLDEQIRQIIVMLEPQWSAKETEWNIELETTEYTGSEELLAQVWINLIGNAVKFTAKGGHIGVDLHRAGDRLRVCVRDDGIGMPNGISKHIFEKFYQGDTARRSDGNGLGLALVRRIVELCGGDVSVTSSPGEGSVFTVELPA